MPTALYYLHDPFAPNPNCATRFGSAVVIEAEGKILLEHRKDNFKWGIISGDIHNTETFKDTAIRKTMKETGISLKYGQLKDLKIFDDPSRIVSFLDGNVYRIVSIAYQVQLEHECPTICGKESTELRWVEASELNEYDIVPIHKEILEFYCKTNGIECNLTHRIYRQ